MFKAEKTLRLGYSLAEELCAWCVLGPELGPQHWRGQEEERGGQSPKSYVCADGFHSETLQAFVVTYFIKSLTSVIKLNGRRCQSWPLPSDGLRP